MGRPFPVEMCSVKGFSSWPVPHAAQTPASAPLLGSFFEHLALDKFLSLFKALVCIKGGMCHACREGG